MGIGGKKIPYTFEERLQIENSLKQGLLVSQIAKLIKRSYNGVLYEIYRVGQPYTAVRSQEIAKERQINRSKNISIVKSRSVYEMRLRNLEMQVEILHETIKEILKNDQKDKRL